MRTDGNGGKAVFICFFMALMGDGVVCLNPIRRIDQPYRPEVDAVRPVIIPCVSHVFLH